MSEDLFSLLQRDTRLKRVADTNGGEYAGPCLTAALDYARRGWPVLPLWWAEGGRCACGNPNCSNAGKHPIGELAPAGLRDATTDTDTIRRWWGRHPHANVGIATGAAAGIIVLDVDGDEGRQSVAGRPMPPTPTARTGRGLHLVLAHPGGVVRNFARKLPGLDLRGDGGYIVAPPSIHVSGRRYEWIISPDDGAPAPCPAWLPELISGRDDHAPTGPAPAVAGSIPTGQRNQMLTSLAGTMRRRGMTPAEILPALQAVNRERCSPPLEDAEVQQIAQSIGRYAPTGQQGDLGHEAVPGGSGVLLGADTLTGQGYLVVVAGEPDTLLLRQEAGDVVGILSLAGKVRRNCPPEGLLTLAGRRKVLVCTAANREGDQAEAHLLALLRKRARRLRPIGGKDLGEMHRAGLDLRAWVLAALFPPEVAAALSWRRACECGVDLEGQPWQVGEGYAHGRYYCPACSPAVWGPLPDVEEVHL